jgi:hypothetical protein
MIPHRGTRFALLMIAILFAFHASAETTDCSLARNIIQRRISENYKGARISVEYPEIPGEAEFNKAVLAEVNPRVKVIKQEADVDAKNPPPTGRRGSIGSNFSVTHTQFGTLSILISFGLDGSMSAHPWEELASINYDACQHHLLPLSDLFLPNSHYLSKLSQITINSLEAREFADLQSIRSGASAKPKNFKTFTLDDQGLTVHFQQYQVAAGAAGSTSVKIPWKELKLMLYKHYVHRN